MAKLTIMRGLPASGKSTMAKKLIEERGNTVRVNKDLLRKMLHFDNFSHRNEGYTRDSARKLVEHFLKTGINVIIDDTNLNPKTLQSWVDLAKETKSKIEHCEIQTPVKECIIRDMNRQDSVGAHVIYKMSMQHLEYLKGQSVIIADLDGTICNIDHRLHYVSADLVEKDWKGFFSEIPNDIVREDVRSLMENIAIDTKSQIIFVSARPETYRNVSEEWLSKNGMFMKGSSILIMREEGDSRPDTEVKSDIYDKYLKNLDIMAIIDDRPSVLRMWKTKGISNVIDVGKGIEF